jgi:cyclophilin family peptidyl-prolyl cis-trans isomerase
VHAVDVVCSMQKMSVPPINVRQHAPVSIVGAGVGTGVGDDVGAGVGANVGGDVGALSMAHAGKDTGGSQFFMVLSETSTRHLDGVHTVFGQITEGLDVLTEIRQNDELTSARVD